MKKLAISGYLFNNLIAIYAIITVARPFGYIKRILLGGSLGDKGFRKLFWITVARVAT
jgi:hypothetical protein